MAYSRIVETLPPQLVTILLPQTDAGTKRESLTPKLGVSAKEVVTQALSEVLSDPDEGLELRPEATDQLRRSLAAMKAGTRQPRQPGSAKGKLLLLAEDDAHLEDFTNVPIGQREEG